MTDAESGSGTLRHWPWLTFALQEGGRDRSQAEELVIHAPHRAAAKQKLWDHIDFEPDYIGAYVYSPLKEKRAEEKTAELGAEINRMLLLAGVVFATLPLWYPVLRAYELVTGNEVNSDAS